MINKSLLAGMLITFSCYLYLLIPDKIIGALLFSVALLTICSFEYKLFTGAIGFQFDKDVFKILFWNLIGCAITSLLLILNNSEIINIARTTVSNKFQVSYFAILIKGLMVGICMWLAVAPWKKKFPIILRMFLTSAFVMFFLICGWEHSIADIVYIFFSCRFNCTIICKWILILFGNILGARMMATLDKDNLLIF